MTNPITNLCENSQNPAEEDIPANIKEWIDNASYEDMLRRNRFAPVGDPMFQGHVGKYFLRVMAEKKAKLTPGEHVAASKRIGW